VEKKIVTIKQVVFIPAKPEEVYDAIMDEKKHAAFTGSKAVINPKVGGKFTAWDGYISGKNIKLERGKRIVQEWKTTEWPDYPPSMLELLFKSKNNGTELTMVHSKVPLEQAESYRKGWYDSYWEPMKKYFKGKHI
jgi:activator of HSP90 ATPase